MIGRSPYRFSSDGDVRVAFETRPIAVPPESWAVWRLHLVLLVLHHCRGNTANRVQLVVLDGVLRTSPTPEGLQRVLAGRVAPSAHLLREDPTLWRAVDLGLGLGLVESPGPGRLRLSDAGRGRVRLLQEMDSMSDERDALESLGSQITQAQVARVIREHVLT